MGNREDQITILQEKLNRVYEERSHLEKRLKQIESQFRETVEMQTDLITLSKADGTVLYANNANCEFFGKTFDQMTGRTFELLIPEEDRERSLQTFHSVSLKNPIVINKHRVIDGRGNIRWMEWRNRGSFNEKGELVTILANGRDITDQVVAEQVRRKAEEEAKELLIKSTELNRLKSNIITLASHELKTPLTAIYGWVKFMHSKRQQGESLDKVVDLEILESLVRNAERIDDLINAYLDVGRIESDHLHLNYTQIDVAKVLDSVIQIILPLAREKNIQIHVVKQSEKIEVDAIRFEQVLINLISNAVKYSPENTSINIQSEKLMENLLQKRLLIKIQDEGYGFTTEEMQVAMDPFPNIYNQRTEKANVKGTGLGLFISKKIIEKHGGSLSISSGGPNKGSLVSISIPIK